MNRIHSTNNNRKNVLSGFVTCWFGLGTRGMKYLLVTRNNCFQIKRLTSRRAQCRNPTSAGAIMSWIRRIDSVNRKNMKSRDASLLPEENLSKTHRLTSHWQITSTLLLFDFRFQLRFSSECRRHLTMDSFGDKSSFPLPIFG